MASNNNESSKEEDKVHAGAARGSESDQHQSKFSNAQPQQQVRPKSKSKVKCNLSNQFQKMSVKEDKGDGDDETIGVNLTDPDDVLHALENCDLTEEETEVLLKQAYDVNRKLKKQLHMHEPSQSRTDRSASTGSRSERSPSRRWGNLNSASLPPLMSQNRVDMHTGKIYSAKMPAPLSRHVPDYNLRSPMHAGHRSGSRTPVKSTSASSISPVKSSTKERPSWDDRFAYT